LDYLLSPESFGTHATAEEKEHYINTYLCFMNLDKTKLETIKDYFRTRPVLKAYLFGSYVRGQADHQSDIDILVDLDYTQRIGLGFIQMQYDLERLLSMKVDLVSSSSLSKHIKPIIDNEKELIYAR
jgi:predicted nucleotidyltransferase